MGSVRVKVNVWVCEDEGESVWEGVRLKCGQCEVEGVWEVRLISAGSEAG